MGDEGNKYRQDSQAERGEDDSENNTGRDARRRGVGTQYLPGEKGSVGSKTASSHRLFPPIVAISSNLD